MTIEMKNDLLNLPNLKFKMDQTVFDYIDSMQNWPKAYSLLDELLQKVAINFNAAIAKNEGQLPKASTYWVLYMDVAAKLLYFTGLAHAHLIDENDVDAKSHIVNLYQISAACLPNAQIEENEEHIEELKKSIAEMKPLNEESIELKMSSSINDCFTQFYTFTKTYE